LFLISLDITSLKFAVWHLLAYIEPDRFMLLSEFDYVLPRDLIAQRPLDRRDSSRMLLLDQQTQSWEDSRFLSFPDLLRGNELLVINDTRVIPARLLGRRLGVRSEEPGSHSRFKQEFLSSEIEVLLTRQLSPDEWEALVRPGRKMQLGERVQFGDGELCAEVIGRGDYGLRRMRLTAPGGVLAAISKLGHIPLPPYIDRKDDAADRERYQTIFAQRPGAVAAPTAGLHFSPAIMERLQQRGVEVAPITLEVGLGTFQPIHEDEIDTHQIHAERYEISEQTTIAIRKARAQGRPILAVGTTVVRALEDAAAKSARKAEGSSVVEEEFLLHAGAAEADIFIKPGHRFRVVDQLLTNFHLPQSTLLVLVSAFAGREFILRAYRHAVETGYRFYSYGDCMWIR
jgi:S-adenosylmethionine:tRNA ribosyltransferase-isomerase